MRTFLGEIGIGIHRLSKVVCHPQYGWAQSNLIRAWMGQIGRGWKNSAFLSWAGTPLCAPGSQFSRLRLQSSSCVCSVVHSCQTLCGPMCCSPRGSSVHGILQASILEQAAIFYSGDLPHTGIKPVSLAPPALAWRFFTSEPPRKPNLHQRLPISWAFRLGLSYTTSFPESPVGRWQNFLASVNCTSKFFVINIVYTHLLVLFF